MEIQEQVPSFYAVLTADVRYSKDINAFEKILYAEITAMTHKTGYCWASNEYFANVFTVSERTISRAIGKLEKHGFVITFIRTNGKKSQRMIKISLDRIVTDKTELSEQVDKNVYDPLDKNVYYNNTSINNNSNKRIDKKSKQDNILESLSYVINELGEKKKELLIEWLNYKKEKKPYTVKSSVEKLIRQFGKESVEKIEAVVDKSIQSEYQGLFWDSYVETKEDDSDKENVVGNYF